MLLYSKWLSLDLPTRIRIAGELGIVKKNSTHVQDNRVVSDGYNIEDVENGLSIENLQRVLHSDHTDIAILWDMLVHSTPAEEGLIAVVPKEEVNEEPKKEPVAEIKKKGRPKKNA